MSGHGNALILYVADVVHLFICLRTLQVLHMEAAGAAAAVVVNTKVGEAPLVMSGDATGRQTATPSIMIEAGSGFAFADWLTAGQALTASLGREPPQLEGPRRRVAISNRVELLLPTSSQQWLQSIRMSDRLPHVLEWIMNDGSAGQLLWKTAMDNMQAKRDAAEAALAEQRAALAAQRAAAQAASGGSDDGGSDGDSGDDAQQDEEPPLSSSSDPGPHQGARRNLAADAERLRRRASRRQEPPDAHGHVPPR